MRDYDTDYRYADAINRRARWGVLIVIAFLFAVAWAGNADGGDGPPPSVLASPILSRSPVPVAAVGSSTTSLPSATTTTSPRLAAVTPATTTTAPTTTTTTTTQPTTATTFRPTTTTTTTTTTTVTTTTSTTTTTTTTTVPPTTTTTVPPTTTTTVPPTTSTTVPPTTTTTLATGGTIHIHDLKGDAKRAGDGRYAKIEVQIRNGEDDNQQGVLVTGRFSNRSVGAVAGTTNNKGQVIFESGPIDADSVTFTVTSLIHPDYRYEPDENRRGPSVTVEFE